jgi:hypothetical protein
MLQFQIKAVLIIINKFKQIGLLLEKKKKNRVAHRFLAEETGVYKVSLSLHFREGTSSCECEHLTEVQGMRT